MTRIARWGGVLLLGLGGAAFAQSSDQDGRLWLPDGASTYSAEVDRLYYAIFYVTTGMFILVEGLILYFCIVYRARPGHRSTYTHGNHKAEIAWTVVPGLMLLGLALWQIPTWNKIKLGFPEPGPGVTTVDVLGEQYKWNFRYPGTKEKFGPKYKVALEEDLAHDYSNISNLHVPFGDKVLLNIRSKDVIHSFFIPHMRVKQDTVPGLRQRIWFQPNRYQLINLKETGEKGKQKREWVTLPAEGDPDQEFKQGGKYHDKRVAVGEYWEKDGVYQPLAEGVKVRVLHQGKVLQSADGRGVEEWKNCDYALGIFEIACAELCGMGHYTMRAFLVVEPRIAYEAWLENETVAKEFPGAAVAWNYWRD